MSEQNKKFYQFDEYIRKNPSLHVEDSSWKVSKIIPLIDAFIHYFNDKIKILDVGGGAGLILKDISKYIENGCGIIVNKYALDLSPGMLKIQKLNNPDIIKALNEDICDTSLDEKEIDLILMIDVLEHIPNQIVALEEMKRISRFIIFKVPLEDNLCSRIWNFAMRGKPRQYAIENIGHINIYNFITLKYQIEKYTGWINYYAFTNNFDRTRKRHYKKTTLLNWIVGFLGGFMFRISPKICSLLFPDFIMILVKCY